ncbi:hypothetical protein LINPERHAP1_LOCUS43390 [Linum perenne]
MRDGDRRQKNPNKSKIKIIENRNFN